MRPPCRPARASRVRALAGRGRQHPVLGGHPAASAPDEPARHALLDRRGAEHARLPEGDEHRAVRLLDEVRDDVDRDAARPARRPSRIRQPPARGRGSPTCSTSASGSWRKRSPSARNSSTGPVVRKRERALAGRIVLDPLALERLGHLARGLDRGEDQRRPAAEDALEDRLDQRVVGAAEDDGVDLSRLQRLRVLAHGCVDLLVRRRGLDQRHEPGARRGEDLRARVERVHGLLVAAARDGRLGGEHADAAVPRRLHGRVRLGGEHADDRAPRSVSWSCGSAAAVAELQAATISLTPASSRYEAISCAKRRISSRGRGPYGQRAPSPR